MKVNLADFPVTSKVDIQIKISATVNVSSVVAQRKVNALLLDHVGTGVYADEPEMLARDGQLCWRVPIILALPSLGPLGQIGTVDIDVQTGEVFADATTWQTLGDHAERLFAGATLQTEPSW